MSGIVVADAGPLHYLVLIRHDRILPELFERVLIPVGVRDELLHTNAPPQVRDWLESPRPWLRIESVTRRATLPGLHRGETEAIQLASETNADGILIDDMDGRAVARGFGLNVFGTVGLLEMAAARGLLDLSATFAELQKTSFFVAPTVLRAALERERLRKKRHP